MTQPFSGSRTSQWYVEETTPGVTPDNPAWTRIRSTGGIPQLIRDTLETAELDDSREKISIDSGNEQVTGEYGVELSFASQDELMAGAMTSNWVAGGDADAGVITVVASSKTFTSATYDFEAAGVRVGDLAGFRDLTGNNAVQFIVTAVATTTITGSGITATLTDETESSQFFWADTLGTGSLCKTYSVLTWLRGKCGTADKFLVTRGLEFTGFNFEIAVNAKVTGSLPFIARSQEISDSAPTGSTYVPDNDNKPYSGAFGKVLRNGALAAYVTSASITNDNSAASQFALGDTGVSFVERGQASNSVSMSAFMENTDLMEAFNGKEITSFDILLSAKNGSMAFSMPTTYLTAATPELGGAGSITQTLEGTALGNANQSSLTVQRLFYTPAP